VNACAAEGVRALLSAAVAEGAVIAHQANAPTDGWYVAPTLLTNVRADAGILRQEIFGPIAPIVVWDNETELVRWINDAEYGLAAYLYAGRLQDAVPIAEKIDAGMVGINRGIVSDPSAPSEGPSRAGWVAKAAGMDCGNARNPVLQRGFRMTIQTRVDAPRTLARGCRVTAPPEPCQLAGCRGGCGCERRRDQARSNRSLFITLTHAATKSCTNFSFESAQA